MAHYWRDPRVYPDLGYVEGVQVPKSKRQEAEQLRIDAMLQAEEEERRRLRQEEEERMLERYEWDLEMRQEIMILDTPCSTLLSCFGEVFDLQSIEFRSTSITCTMSHFVVDPSILFRSRSDCGNTSLFWS